MNEDQTVKPEDLDTDIADLGKPLPDGLGDALWQKIKGRTIDLSKEPPTPSLERDIAKDDREV